MTTPEAFAHRVLSRLGYGPRPGDVERFVELGATDNERLASYLDQQLDPSGLDDSDLERQIRRAGLESIPLTRREAWAVYFASPAEGVSGDTPANDLVRYTFARCTYSEAQLYEMMVRFWHDHFNVYAGQNVVRSMIARYDFEVIRPRALGNFRELLGEVASSTCMLYYLDNYVSTAAGPNENWARELFELHTLGAENYLGSAMRQNDVEGHPDAPIGYVDDDVYEATRCFTGWSIDDNRNNNTGRFRYNREDHDRFQKNVLGRFIPADQSDLRDGEDVLDVLAAHPGTGRHVCRKLCRRFVADTPPNSLVDSAAEVFTDNVDAPDQIARVLRHIIESAEFAEAPAKVKRPFEFTVSMLRATEAALPFGANDDATNSFLFQFNRLGQEPFFWPPPDGHPDTANHWLNTTSLFMRWDLVNSTIADVNGEIYSRPLLRRMEEADSAKTPVEIVDFWYRRLLGRAPEAETETELVDFMAQGFNPNFDVDDSDETEQRVLALIALILMSPEFQWR